MQWTTHVLHIFLETLCFLSHICLLSNFSDRNGWNCLWNYPTCVNIYLTSICFFGFSSSILWTEKLLSISCNEYHTSPLVDNFENNFRTLVSFWSHHNGYSFCVVSYSFVLFCVVPVAIHVLNWKPQKVKISLIIFTIINMYATTTVSNTNLQRDEITPYIYVGTLRTIWKL